MEIVGTATFSIEDDDSGFMPELPVVQHAGRLWLVATQLVPNGPGAPVPEWLVPMESVARWDHEPGGRNWLAFAVPRELVGPDATMESRLRAGAVLNPLLANIPGRAGTH